MNKKTAQIIDGKVLAEKILLELKGKISRLNRPPGLATILIGDDPASHLYVRNKKKASEKVGIEFHEYLCGQKCYSDITELEILEMIKWLNKNPSTDGIIVQLPLPKKFNAQKIINSIDPKKDVDGFHPENPHQLNPPLIAAIKLALAYTQENLEDKKVLIISKNPIFSNPLEKILLQEGLKIESIRPDHKELVKKTQLADVIITLVGKKHFIKKSMVKNDVIIIDAGTNLVDKNKWVGDVDPEVKEVAKWFTPVPGGIGPLTVAMVLKNTYELAK